MSFLDTLLRAVRYVYNAAGVQMPQENGIQFSGAVTVTDVPSLGVTLVNVGTSSASNITAPTVWTYASGPSFAYPSAQNTHVGFDTTGGQIAAQLDPSPVAGEINGAKDLGFALGTHSLVFSDASSTVQIEWPIGTKVAGNVGASLGGGYSGIAVAWQWYPTYATWYIESLSLPTAAGSVTYGPPVHFNFANTGTVINSATGLQSIIQFLVDTSGGGPCAYGFAAVSAYQDGTVFVFTDNGPSPGSWGGTYGPPQLSTTDGSTIANVASPSTFTTSVTLPALDGASVEYVLDKSTSPARFLINTRPRDGSGSTTATGPSVSSTVALVPSFQANTTAAYTVTCTMTVTHAGGGSEAVGDTYITSGVLAWKNVAGTVSAIASVTGLASVVSDSTMTGASFTQNAASIGFTTPSTLNSATIVFIRVTIVPIGVA